MVNLETTLVGLSGVSPKDYHSGIAIDTKVEELNSFRSLRKSTTMGVQGPILEGLHNCSYLSVLMGKSHKGMTRK